MFKFQPGCNISWPRFFIIFLDLARQMPECSTEIGHDCFLLSPYQFTHDKPYLIQSEVVCIVGCQFSLCHGVTLWRNCGMWNINIQHVHFMSVLQYFIPEAIPGQKCHLNMGLIPMCYRDMGISNVAWLQNYYLSDHSVISLFVGKGITIQFTVQFSKCSKWPLSAWYTSWFIWLWKV